MNDARVPSAEVILRLLRDMYGSIVSGKSLQEAGIPYRFFFPGITVKQDGIGVAYLLASDGIIRCPIQGTSMCHRGIVTESILLNLDAVSVARRHTGYMRYLTSEIASYVERARRDAEEINSWKTSLSREESDTIDMFQAA